MGLHPKTVILPCILLYATLVYGTDEYIERACDRVFHVGTDQLSKNREDDLKFSYTDETCCCKDDILELFRDRTSSENDRVNPATDTMLKSLAEHEKTIKYRIKQVENLKQINAIYSMPEPIIMSPVQPSDNNYSSEGCQPLDFSNEADRDAYLATIDRMENGGLGIGAYTLHGERSSAFGRYQIMPATAADLCTQTPSEWDCCASWQSSPQCQDEMFRLLTIRNTQGLLDRGIPLNTCTVYMAHQQGTGGVYWLFGGDSPYSSIDTLQSVVKNNVGTQTWQNAIDQGMDINDPDVLREIYKGYWNEKFGADVVASEGTEMSPEDFQVASEEFIEYANKQKSLWREGVLLELKEIEHSLKMENKK